MFHRLRYSVLMRFVRCNSFFQKEQILVQCLPSRSVLKIYGKEVDDYLQGLITNDINHLKKGSRSMYTMFLNSKGRVLYDSIIYRQNDENSFLVECDYNVINDLKAHLNMFKIRRKIHVECLDSDFNVWNVNYMGNVTNILQNKIEAPGYEQFSLEVLNGLEHFSAACDPRVKGIGWRVIAPKECYLLALLRQFKMNSTEEMYYNSVRHTLGVGEGTEELPPGKCFPLEANCDYLHGVSFHKGCYIGQELTARTHHTGVVRKRLMPLFFEKDASELPVDSAIISGSDDKSLGKVKCVGGKLGIGLLRVQEALMANSLECSGMILKTFRPSWWPSEAPKDRRNVS